MSHARNLAISLLYAGLLYAGLLQVAAPAAAQPTAYPGRQVRLIATYPPGGASDIMARIVGQKLSELWAQPVVIENKSGANGSIGLEYAAHQPNDGSSFVIGNLGPVSVNPLISKVPYEMNRDFAPVSLIASSPVILVINAGIPANNLKELIALARAKPGTLNFGSAGSGSLGHLGGEMMKRMANIDIIHVPYKGGILAINDVLAGQVQMMMADPQPILPHMRAGKVRALAVSTAKRSPVAPEIPTLGEAGLPGFVADNWWGVYLPAGTPKPIVDKLQADLTRAMQSAEVKDKFIAMGIESLSTTPEGLRDYARAETEKYSKLVREAGIKAE
ncbi:MAG: tripartite tricarboxylate transporter substrate binding protein [Betaproteobacteria bacterium]|nr:tripartite tricarboxylate transporter substrate binding protein [Betaproteobacteria bacterium]